MQIEETFTAELNPEFKTKFKHVMLIDDNPIDNLVNTQLLNKGEFSEKITVMEGPEEALEFIRSCKLDELPDIIFLDILMPVMDGFAFLDEYEKLDKKIIKQSKVVMLSTSDSFHHLNQANKNKLVTRFLNKPLTSEIISAISS